MTAPPHATRLPGRLACGLDPDDLGPAHTRRAQLARHVVTCPACRTMVEALKGLGWAQAVGRPATGLDQWLQATPDWRQALADLLAIDGSQQALASRLGVRQPQVARWIGGTVPGSAWQTLLRMHWLLAQED